MKYFFPNKIPPPPDYFYPVENTDLKKCIMKIIIKLAVIGLSYLWIPALSAQPVSDRLAGYITNINQFNQLNPQEKVYLHFDNTGYYLGETIWFKAYIVDASFHRNTSLSKVLHVELLTPQGAVADSRKLKIKDGQCHGEFHLGGKYRSGFYEIRAYTRSMLNFGDECMFSRVFPIYKTPDVGGDYADKKMDASSVLLNERAKPEKHSRIDLSFYPEGGNAVIGLRSRIAFKATDSRGEGIPVTGTVYNAENEPVASFTTLHQGMGFFELTPEAAEYKVTAEYEGKKRNFSFTRIIPAGYVMQARHLNDTTLQIRLQQSPGLPVDTIGFSVSCRGTVYAAKTIRITDEAKTFQLSKNELPAGCLQLTLFDRQGKVLAERLIFNTGPVNYLTVEATPGKSIYKPLKRVQMELNVKDKNGNPVSTGFSLAVRDAETELHTGYQGNILTDLLLSSDVKGYIENPMQYFVNPGRSARIRLDLLMLVQGWRRYNWQTMAGIAPFDVKYYAEEGLDISGKVLEWGKNSKQTGGTVTYWILKNGEAFHGKCKTDENGRFHFQLPDSANIGQRRDLGLQYSVKGKRKHCRILLDRPNPQGKNYSFHDTFVKDTLVIIEEQADSLQKTSIMETQYLEEAVVQKEKSKPDIVLDTERDINALQDKGAKYPGTVGEYLKSKVTAISGPPTYQYGHQKTVYLNNSYHTHDSGKTDKNPHKTDPARIPVPLYDIENVRQIDIYYKNRMAWHKIVCPLCFGRIPHEPAVLILVKLHNGKQNTPYRAGIRQTFYDGYSPSKEFYHVDNSDKFPGETDFRRTLYWNPDVKADKQGKVKISFYNNSHCKQASVSAEGITAQGTFIVGADDLQPKP